MRRALAALVLALLLAGAAGASGDLYRLEIKGTGKITLARPHGDGELSIEIPADFEATMTLVPRDEGWAARDAHGVDPVVGGDRILLGGRRGGRRPGPYSLPGDRQVVRG